MKIELRTVDMVNIMIHHHNGGKIEFKSDNDWGDCKYPTWNWEKYTYRIKYKKLGKIK